MPRPALIPPLLVLVLALAAPAAGLSPHLDSSTVPGGCRACHEGHGVSSSPMLPGSVETVCLSCHGPPVVGFCPFKPLPASHGLRRHVII